MWKTYDSWEAYPGSSHMGGWHPKLRAVTSWLSAGGTYKNCVLKFATCRPENTNILSLEAVISSLLFFFTGYLHSKSCNFKIFKSCHGFHASTCSCEKMSATPWPSAIFGSFSTPNVRILTNQKMGVSLRWAKYPHGTPKSIDPTMGLQ